MKIYKIQTNHPNGHVGLSKPYTRLGNAKAVVWHEKHMFDMYRSMKGQEMPKWVILEYKLPKGVVVPEE